MFHFGPYLCIITPALHETQTLSNFSETSRTWYMTQVYTLILHNFYEKNVFVLCIFNKIQKKTIHCDICTGV